MSLIRNNLKNQRVTLTRATKYADRMVEHSHKFLYARGSKSTRANLVAELLDSSLNQSTGEYHLEWMRDHARTI